MKHLLTCIILVMATQTIFGQKLYPCNRKVSFWGLEKNGAFFSVQLPGNAKTTGNAHVLTIGNFPLQYVIVEKKDYLKGLPDTTGTYPLVSYAQSEAAYLQDQMHTTLAVDMRKVPVPGGMALVWYFDMPPGITEDVRKQIFVDIVIGDKIFGLSSSQFIDQTYDEVEDFLINTISTLKRLNSAGDFDRLCGK